jgi:hypothetical protein
MKRLSNRTTLLLSGDALTLAVVTLFGFVQHQTLESAGLRILATYIPLFVAWLLLSPFLGVFESAKISDTHQLWRPFWAMVLAAPLAAWLRGAWLGTPIQPIFVVVLGGTSAIALLIWRVIFLLGSQRYDRLHE